MEINSNEYTRRVQLHRLPKEMSDSSSGGKPAVGTEVSQFNNAVEAILRLRNPVALAFEPVAKVIAAKTGERNELLDQLQAERQRLLRLSASQLAQAYSHELAAAEARQFYNLPSAMADFHHWALMDFWSVEEAVALLLGRDPTVVNASSLKKHESSPFAQRYTKLLQLAQRSEVMTKSDRIRPADAINWALMIGAAKPPVELEKRIRMRATHTAEAPAVETDKTDTTPQASSEPGLIKKWTPDRLKELSEYREKHGTKAAAQHFGIAPARVRQLLPKKPAPAPSTSVFTYRRK